MNLARGEENYYTDLILNSIMIYNLHQNSGCIEFYLQYFIYRY